VKFTRLPNVFLSMLVPFFEFGQHICSRVWKIGSRLLKLFEDAKQRRVGREGRLHLRVHHRLLKLRHRSLELSHYRMTVPGTSG
jgi:hypothetical protein